MFGRIGAAGAGARAAANNNAQDVEGLMTADIKQAHIFVEGHGDTRLGPEVVRALHPEFLTQPTPPRIEVHAVVGQWPADMFAYAYTALRAHWGIALTTTNCLLQDGSAYGKRLYMVYVKE